MCHLEEFLTAFHPPFSKIMVFMLQKGISSAHKLSTLLFNAKYKLTLPPSLKIL